MIADKLLQFSDAQVLAATGVSTNVVDTWAHNGGQASHIADGEPMAIVIAPTVSADSTTGDETYAVEVQSSTDEAFTAPVTHGTLTIPAAKLVAGKGMPFMGLPGGEYNRYIRLRYVLGGTTPSVTLDAFLTALSMIPKYNKYYKSGFTVL